MMLCAFRTRSVADGHEVTKTRRNVSEFHEGEWFVVREGTAYEIEILTHCGYISLGGIQDGVQNSALIDKDRTFFRINHRAIANRGLAWSWLVMLLLAGCASSSARLVAPARPAIDPAAVQIYRTPPASLSGNCRFGCDERREVFPWQPAGGSASAPAVEGGSGEGWR